MVELSTFFNQRQIVEHYQYHSTCLRHDLQVKFSCLLELVGQLSVRCEALILLNIGRAKSSGGEYQLIYSLYDMESRQLIRIISTFDSTLSPPSIRSVFSNAFEMEERLWSVSKITIDDYDRDELLRSRQLAADKLFEIPGRDGVALSFEGDLVAGVQLKYGFGRTMVEQRLLESSYFTGSNLLERFPCNTAPIGSTVWCMAVEELLQITLPPKAQALRMLLMELARIGGHLETIGAMVDELGFLPASSLALNAEEQLRDLYTTLSLARYGMGGVRLGGVQLNLTPTSSNLLLIGVDKLERIVNRLEKLLSRSRVWIARTQCGVLGPNQALEFGITGVNLRASGLSHDQRKYGALYFYPELEFDLPLGGGGSSYDRYLVRVEEIGHSLKIIRQLIASMPEGEMIVPELNLNYSPQEESLQETQQLLNHFQLISQGIAVPAGVAHSLLEGSDGLVGVDLIAAGDGHPLGVNIISPAISVIQMLPTLLRGMELEDAIITLTSLGMIRPMGAK
ncbi:MAG: NADH-quinone oxidoreductase subunit D [Bdellovibrionales bacterium]|jgi:NADH:ubiquinone oxidoreductase subunit D|nr:NADH-quinone oxidoreductase subunit D [Bdellovibrionales bacterium]MBT3525062.1 NADH-quinone oxidoreductase subunit D [Bdellovibrionales bacterium]